MVTHIQRMQGHPVITAGLIVMRFSLSIAQVSYPFPLRLANTLDISQSPQYDPLDIMYWRK